MQDAKTAEAGASNASDMNTAPRATSDFSLDDLLGLGPYPSTPGANDQAPDTPAFDPFQVHVPLAYYLHCKPPLEAPLSSPSKPCCEHCCSLPADLVAGSKSSVERPLHRYSIAFVRGRLSMTWSTEHCVIGIQALTI